MKRWIAACLCLALLLSGCQDTNATPTPSPSAPASSDSASPTDAPTPTPAPTDMPAPAMFDMTTYPRVDGSTATIPLSMAIAKATTGETDEEILLGLAAHQTTSSSYRNLLYGNADLCLSYEPSADVKAEIESSGVELLMTPIGRDALVFLRNADNPVTDLTTQQIQDIYAGKVLNWKDVGGNDVEIIAFQRPEDSGSQTLMRKLVMGGIDMAKAPAELYPSEMEGLVEAVAEYKNTANAIGFSVYYYVSRMFLQDDIQLLSVDGVPPTNDAIRDGEYPFVNDFFCVIRKDAAPDSAERQLYDFITGAQGKAIIEEAGYVGL